MSESRDEQKLWLILFQIRGVRARLNSLAIQHWLFTTLASLICGAALIFLAAFEMSALMFLVAGVTILIVAVFAAVCATRSALRMSSSMSHAAALADDRANLKGRLTTVLTAPATSKRSPLWPYLVEDTYTLRQNFEPAQIEPRWLSRSLLTLVISLLVALLIVPFALQTRAQRMAVANSGGQIIADLNGLNIRPADPGLSPNAEIYADPATMKKLQEKLAAAEAKADHNALGRMVNRARNLADRLQNEIIGQSRAHQNLLKLVLRDKSQNPDQANPQSGNSTKGGHGAANSGNSSNKLAQGGQPLKPAPQFGSENGRDRAGQAGSPGNKNSQSGKTNPNNQLFGEGNNGGGPGHGSGTDPQNLFGQASASPFGSNSFKIAINAQLSDEASSPGAPSYVPPKVHVPLNSYQAPDQPIARSPIPASDQPTIKRVFER